MALDRGIEEAYSHVDVWHAHLSSNGERANLSQQVLQSRQSIPLTEPAIVNSGVSWVVAGLEFGIFETPVGVKDTGVLVRVTESVDSPITPSILTGEPVSRTKDGGVVRTIAFPLGAQAERTLGRLPVEVVSGIAAKVRAPRVA